MFQKTISTTCLKSKSKRRWALGAEMRKRAFKRALLNLQKTNLSKKQFENIEKRDENHPLFIKIIQTLYSLVPKKYFFFVVVVCKQPLILDKMSRSGHLITNDDPVRCALTGLISSNDKLGLLLHEVIYNSTKRSPICPRFVLKSDKYIKQPKNVIVFRPPGETGDKQSLQFAISS